jgi:hypothetical protein
MVVVMRQYLAHGYVHIKPFGRRGLAFDYFDLVNKNCTW